MKKNLPLVLALAGTVSVAACSKSTDNQPVASATPSGESTAPPANAANQREQALVRIVQAVPGPAVDLMVDQAPLATEVAYASVTPYREVPASADDFTLRAAGKPDGAVLAENSEGIMSGKHYTLVAFPGKDNDRAALQVIADDVSTPAEGRARVRVIHAAGDVDEIDVTAKGSRDTLFDDVDFREATGYEDVDPSIVALDLRSQDGERVVASPTISIESGRSYTVVVTGKANGEPALKALVIEDRAVGQPATN